jgi:hypothetical protein
LPSADAELAYVNAHVSPLLTGPVRTELGGPSSWTSDGDYAVVIVRSTTGYWLYVNVTTGSVLNAGSISTTSGGTTEPPRIKYVSRFVCATD